MRLNTFLLALVLAATPLSSRAQGSLFSEAVRHGSIAADLANALAQIAWLSHIPVIAELAQPLPRVQIAAGTHSVEYLLQDVVRQAPEYQWEAEGKVIHFYNRQLRVAEFNFLNLKFPRFVMPSNLSELKLTFPTREYGLLQGVPGGGIITTGFGDATLEKRSLQPATLENVTSREILLRVANESPAFLSVIVFSNAKPTKMQMERDFNRNWFWQAFKEHRLELLNVQPPVTSRR